MNDLIKRIFSSIILLALVFYFVISGSLHLLFLIIVCFFVASYEWHKMTKKINHKILGFFFLILSFYSFYEITINYDIIFILFICVSTDIGGYIFGKFFKGPKLTKISPNKTYAGMIGGFIVSLIFLSIYLNWINYEITINLFLVTILLSSISQIGDIMISYFKRLSKIKNTGKIIPGHGGLLDRIDGMIFAFPIYYLIERMSYII